MRGAKDSLAVVNSPRQFFVVCLRENDRRLDLNEPRLLRSTFVPIIDYGPVMRTINCAGVPRLPAESRTRTVTRVSPAGNPNGGSITAQNCRAV
jgi:hypothetical protein